MVRGAAGEAQRWRRAGAVGGARTRRRAEARRQGGSKGLGPMRWRWCGIRGDGGLAPSCSNAAATATASVAVAAAPGGCGAAIGDRFPRHESRGGTCPGPTGSEGVVALPPPTVGSPSVQPIAGGSLTQPSSNPAPSPVSPFAGRAPMVAAVRKELEDALARADGLTARLQTTEAERAKVVEAAKASIEASTAHLGQLQEARAQRDGTRFFVLLSLLPAFVPPSCCAYACFFLYCLHRTREGASGDTRVVNPGRRSEGGVGLRHVQGRPKLGVTLNPDASPAANLAA